MKLLRYLPLLLSVALVTVAALLPNFTLADLRIALPWFSELISRIEVLRPDVDGTHVLMFMMLGMASVLALAHRSLPVRLGTAMLGILAAALASELVQFWVPGRTPLWMDVRDDLIGGAVGVILGLVLLCGWRLVRAGTVPQSP